MSQPRSEAPVHSQSSGITPQASVELQPVEVHSVEAQPLEQQPHEPTRCILQTPQSLSVL
jgi:hypothetical protein